MENASKALIIAGAILLSIVLITLGVLIIGRGQEAIEQTNIDDQVVSTWNQKWTKYEGDKVSGTTVNLLINEVLSSNAIAAKNQEPEKIIRIWPNGTDITVGTGYDFMAEGNTTIDTNASGSTKKGTKSCTKYANPSAKYKVYEFKYNGYGYVCQFRIQLVTE